MEVPIIQKSSHHVDLILLVSGKACLLLTEQKVQSLFVKQGDGESIKVVVHQERFKSVSTKLCAWVIDCIFDLHV